MKQLIQNFKSGELKVEEVPVPALKEKHVFIENKYSLISVGTEKSTVKTAQASLIGKAKERPDLVAQVMQNIKKEGLKATIDKVITKLDTLKALGYSTSGVVKASMDSNNRFQAGDRVACAGQDYASHAEFVCVPQNLVAKIPDNVSFEEAAFTTLGSIAIQGVRQASPLLGDNVCVIGLGLLGNITSQILRANGCNVFGIDINEQMIQLAKKTACDEACNRNDDALSSLVSNFTKGYGFDSVIITAATSSSDPIVYSGTILRKKGRVVVVGDVKMDVPRNPDYYRKELELRMSCSYGPGRYDIQYEESGIDYPVGYVRWTEQRNMEAFLKLVAGNKINLKDLITHIFSIDQAADAYDIVMGKKKEFYIGMLFKYQADNDKRTIKVNDKIKQTGNLVTAFIGAGSFAQSYLIPGAKKRTILDTVVTTGGVSARNIAKKFGFSSASTEPDSIFSNDSINTVFIATRHDSHAQYIIKSLTAGKNTYVEKPLTVNENELDEIINVYDSLDKPYLFTGYNRRFAPASRLCKEYFDGIKEPLIMNMTINAGYIPKDHWTQTEQGGGRIIGEMCHFVDLMQYLSNSNPVSVFASAINSENAEIKNDDNLVITIQFQNGSVGVLTYFANGDKAMPKERIEVYGGGKIYRINNFINSESYAKNKLTKHKLAGKGHAQEIIAFIDGIKNHGNAPISFESLVYTSRTTFRIIDSLQTGLTQEIKL